MRYGCFWLLVIAAFSLVLCSRRWETLNYISFSSGSISVFDKTGLEVAGNVGRISFPAKISVGEASFSVIHISFPYSGICAFSMYQRSSLSIERSYKDPNGDIHVELSEISGMVLARLRRCNMNFGDLRASEAVVRMISEDPENIRAEVIEGLIKHKDREVKAGSGIVIRKDVSEVYSLNRPVEPILPLPGRFPKPFLLMWRRAEPAVTYFLEISDDRDFETVVLVHETDRNVFFPEQITMSLTSDVYFWRVWYRDRAGRGSFFSVPVSFVVGTQRIPR